MRPDRGARPKLEARRDGRRSLLGSLLDLYRLVDFIGEGHTHSVFRVEQVETGFSFALKLPLTPLDADLVDLAARDYAVIGGLDDPHIARIHEFVRSPTHGPYVVCELVERAPIAETPPMPWRRALAIVAQMCAPLHAAAEAGHFSRKLSAQHVFLESRAPTVMGGDPYRGVVESADFVKIVLGTNAGARPPAVDTQVRGYFGALDTTAPELLGGERGDERCYVFTLGAFAYFLITGQWPFGELSFPARILPMATFAPPAALVPELPRPIENLLATCLSHDPKKRYPTTLVLRDALATFG